MTKYRNATLGELSLVLNWAAQEGWNPGLDDADAFYAADPLGFFVAVDERHDPIASISVVNHSDDFAFLGLYIVRPKFRGRGVGLGLWKHAMHHAGSRSVGLDGVEAQQGNYRTSGFEPSGVTTRYIGYTSGQLDRGIHDLDPDDVEKLIRFEAAASGVSKPAYLRPWLTGSGTRTTFVKRDQSGIAGFCTIRICKRGAKIGPLVAKDAIVAHELLLHAAKGIDGPISLDVPEASKELTELCKRLEWQPCFRTAQMYKGPFNYPGHRCFAVASLELG